MCHITKLIIFMLYIYIYIYAGIYINIIILLIVIHILQNGSANWSVLLDSQSIFDSNDCKSSKCWLYEVPLWIFLTYWTSLSSIFLISLNSRSYINQYNISCTVLIVNLIYQLTLNYQPILLAHETSVIIKNNKTKNKTIKRNQKIQKQNNYSCKYYWLKCFMQITILIITIVTLHLLYFLVFTYILKSQI